MRDQAVVVDWPPPLEQSLERCRGVAELRFGRGAGRASAALEHLYQETPCRLLFPRPEPGDLDCAVLLTTSGGLTGGDSLRVSIEAAAEARAVVTTQAAEKIYRAVAADTKVDIELAVGPGAWLEWLPQETILFQGARLARRTTARVAPGGRLLAGEILVFGRTARGERLARGRLRDGWRVYRDGRLAWADALHLEDDIGATLDHPAGFDRAVAAATLIYVADDAAERLDRTRQAAEEGASRAAATVVGGVLLVRLLGRDAKALRQDFAALCAGLRAAGAGLPARLPRVWAT